MTLDRSKRRQVVLNVPNSKYGFFMKLLKHFEYVRIEDNDGDSREVIMDNFNEAFQNMKLIKDGKLEGRPAEELLNEL
ncbi:MAG: hypothetical protein LBR50_01725 [Tannerella sp.]|nr:hypothetical protein [Tannerella sp.]